MHNNFEQQITEDSRSLSLNNDFWTYIYDCCQQLEINDTGKEFDSESVKLILGTIVESSEKRFDPADNFKEYLVVLLCKTILKNISEQD